MRPALADDRWELRRLYTLGFSSEFRLQNKDARMAESKARLQLRQWLGGIAAFTLLTHYCANEREQSGSYRSDLRCAIARADRSSADAPPRWIRMQEARRLASLPACRKHIHLGRLHARRTLCRPTVHKFRALLVVASLLVLLQQA